MTPEQFKIEMRNMEGIRKGNGPLIATMAKVKYTRYQNAIRGLVTNPRTLAAIVNATRALFEELKETGRFTKVESDQTKEASII